MNILIKMENQVTPQQMDVICNLQMMYQKIGIKGHSFEYLSKKSFDELFEMQNEMIVHYNQAIKNQSKN